VLREGELGGQVGKYFKEEVGSGHFEWANIRT
jgi:hypothetical protein